MTTDREATRPLLEALSAISEYRAWLPPAIVPDFDQFIADAIHATTTDHPAVRAPDGQKLIEAVEVLPLATSRRPR